jgi:hypothetical protein
MKQYENITYAGKEWTNNDSIPLQVRNPVRWLSDESTIFAIGSCFAVNFGRWISAHGINIVSPNWGLHYNSQTVLSEIQVCLGKSHNSITWKSNSLKHGTRYYDAKRHPIYSSTIERLNSLREEIENSGKIGIRSATGFVVTLGLSEIWEQKTEHGWECINRAPLEEFGTEIGTQFRNRFQTVEEIKSDLAEIVRCINSCTSNIRPIVFTVSPVPLKSSGAAYDSRISNVRSKSNIVAAIHEFLDCELTPKNTSYFPAFEMFYQSRDYDLIWQRDGRHVRAEKINKVCKAFVNAYAHQPRIFDKEIQFQVPEV